MIGFIAEEKHDLKVVAAGVEVVEGTAFHTDLYKLILEENALPFEAVQLVALLLIVGVKEQPKLLTASHNNYNGWKVGAIYNRKGQRLALLGRVEYETLRSSSRLSTSPKKYMCWCGNLGCGCDSTCSCRSIGGCGLQGSTTLFPATFGLSSEWQMGYFVAQVNLSLNLSAIAAAQGHAAHTLMLPRHTCLCVNHLADEDVVAMVDVSSPFCIDGWVYMPKAGEISAWRAKTLAGRAN